jgi:hypothetical protein
MIRRKFPKEIVVDKNRTCLYVSPKQQSPYIVNVSITLYLKNTVYSLPMMERANVGTSNFYMLSLLACLEICSGVGMVVLYHSSVLLFYLFGILSL